MSKKKRKASRYYSFWRILVRPIAFIAFRMKFKGVDNVPESGSYILASNHISAPDPIMIGEGLKRQVMFMGKAELFEKRFPGNFFRRLGGFPVERGTSAAIGAIKHFEQVVRDGDLMCIFIEGTRSKDGEFLQPKSGVSLIAYDTKTPVIPVCITKIRRRTVIHYGVPLSLTDMGFENGGAREYRSASRVIMEHIKALREQDLSE